MSGGEFCHTIDSNDGILFDRLFQANNRSVSRSDTALLDSTYDHDSNDATSFNNQSHRTLIHSLQSTLHRPMETSENAQRAKGDAVLGAAFAETSMPADQAAPQDSQQKGVASSIPEKMFEISKLSNALMGSIEIYLDLCEHTKKLPAAIASRSELLPDSQDLSYLRSTKNFDDIIRMYTEKIAQLDARITALQSTKPTFLKTARTVTESYEPSGPHPGPQEQLSKPPPRRIVKDLGRPRVAMAAQGKILADTNAFFEWCAERVKEKGIDFIHTWNPSSLHNAYASAHPSHCGFTSWIGHATGPRTTKFTMTEILQKAFPSLQESEIMLALPNRRKKQAPSYNTKALHAFLVDKLKRLLCLPDYAPPPAASHSNDIGQRFDVACDAIIRSVQERWPDMRKPLWKVVPRENMAKVWHALIKDPSADSTALIQILAANPLPPPPPPPTEGGGGDPAAGKEQQLPPRPPPPHPTEGGGGNPAPVDPRRLPPPPPQASPTEAPTEGGGEVPPPPPSPPTEGGGDSPAPVEPRPLLPPPPPPPASSAGKR